MRTITLSIILSLISLFGCSQKPETVCYKNLFTNQFLTKADLDSFIGKLHLSIPDSLKGKENITIHFRERIVVNDSIIQPFNYDIRVGDKYLIRADTFAKIGMKVEPHKFVTINGESVVIGGKQPKPTLLNLWFVNCGGCVAEIPALNKLKEKYSDKCNFIALTFDDEEMVKKFLVQKSFNYNHICNAEEFIKYIGTHPYPENIFINKEGFIEYIEGGIGGNDNLDKATEYFDLIINKLWQ